MGTLRCLTTCFSCMKCIFCSILSWWAYRVTAPLPFRHAGPVLRFLSQNGGHLHGYPPVRNVQSIRILPVFSSLDTPLGPTERRSLLPDRACNKLRRMNLHERVRLIILTMLTMLASDSEHIHLISTRHSDA